MSIRDGYAPGLFCWVDLMTPDAAAATRFYEALFGWSHVVDRDDQGNAYTMFSFRDLLVAGMGEMSAEMKRNGMPPVWTSYVCVDDLDATVARCQELGGSAVAPRIDIKTAGSMAILTDPEGAHISLWQPGQHKGAGLVNDPGGFAWNELATRDIDRAAHFYAGLFGWTIVRSEGDGPPYYEIELGDRLNGGIRPAGPEMGGAPANWSVYFSIKDCDETVKRLQELGGNLQGGPIDIEPGRFAAVTDPQGAFFQVMYLHAPE